MQKNGGGQGQEKMDERSYGFAIQFARMWGIAETLEPLPNRGMEVVKDKVTAWAVECADSGEDDSVKFFVAKIEEEFSMDLSFCFGGAPFQAK